MEIPPQLAAILVRHKLSSGDAAPSAAAVRHSLRTAARPAHRAAGLEAGAEAGNRPRRAPDVSAAARGRRARTPGTPRVRTLVPRLPALRRQRGHRGRRLGGGGLVAARSQVVARDAGCLRSGDPHDRPHRPPANPHGRAVWKRAGSDRPHLPRLLQAGGHRFDPAWLHRRKAVCRDGFSVCIARTRRINGSAPLAGLAAQPPGGRRAPGPPPA